MLTLPLLDGTFTGDFVITLFGGAFCITFVFPTFFLVFAGFFALTLIAGGTTAFGCLGVLPRATTTGAFTIGVGLLTDD